jgi:hypothetical protein
MKRAAAWALAGPDARVRARSDVLDRGVHNAVAEAVRHAAIDSGVADPARAPAHL